MLRQVEVQAQAVGINLPPVDIAEQLQGAHQFFHFGGLARSQALGVQVHRHRFQAAQAGGANLRLPKARQAASRPERAPKETKASFLPIMRLETVTMRAGPAKALPAA